MKSLFAEIVAYKSYADIDQLNGTDLKDGETLEVQFPDGTNKVVEIVVHESRENYGDHGHVYTMPVKKAHFTLDYHGLEVDCPLEGLKARRL